MHKKICLSSFTIYLIKTTLNIVDGYILCKKNVHKFMVHYDSFKSL